VQLRWASEVGGEATAPVARPQPSLAVPASTFASLRCASLSLTAAAAAAAAPAGAAGVGTDAAIGAKKVGRPGRQLEAWVPEAGDEPPAPLQSGLDPGHRGGAGGWDQFAANNAAFGVVSSFDENLYTTKLERGSAGISEAEAERLAREITAAAAGAGGARARGARDAEAVGDELAGEEEEDEEAAFSSVLRDAPGGDAAAAARDEETFGAAPAAPAAPAGGAPAKSTLNPNAKPFSFNPAARPFVPPAALSASAASAAAAGSSAGAAAAMSAAAAAAYGYPPPMPPGMAVAGGGWNGRGGASPYPHPGMMGVPMPYGVPYAPYGQPGMMPMGYPGMGFPGVYPAAPPSPPDGAPRRPAGGAGSERTS